MPYSVAVDIGGTFTDLVAYDDDSRSVVFTKSPTTYDNFVAGVLDCFAKAKLDPRAAILPQSRHDAGHQLADPAQGRQSGVGHDAGLSRRAGDCTRQSARSVRSALPARRSADPARVCGSRWRSASAARARLSSRWTSTRCRARRQAQGARRRVGRDLLHEFLRQPAARGAGRRRLLRRLLPDVYVTCSAPN